MGSLNTLADEIRSARLKLRLSQNDVGKGIGVDGSYISLIEKAERNPSRDVCKGLARELNLPLDRLLKLAGHYPKDAPIEFTDEEIDLVLRFRDAPADVKEFVLGGLRRESQ